MLAELWVAMGLNRTRDWNWRSRHENPEIPEARGKSKTQLQKYINLEMSCLFSFHKEIVCLYSFWSAGWIPTMAEHLEKLNQ